MELTSVLIIDDVAKVRSEVLEEFKVRGIRLLQASELAELEEHLKHPLDFQMIVLDWLLDDQSSTLSRVCLQKIREKYFVPVMIWTEQLGRFQDEAEDVKKVFPEICLIARSKTDVECKDLLEFLNQWYETTPAKLSNQFRQSLAVSAEEALYKLAEHSEDDLARGLKTLISLENSSEVDMEHAVDVLLRLVGRAIYNDENFITQIRETIGKLEHDPGRAKKIESRIKKLHMYYRPRDKFVRTGDIVKITFEAQESANIFQGLVLTPACDLAQPGKTNFLRLVLIKEKKDTDRKSGEDRLMLDRENKLEVCFHEILVVENKSLAADTTRKSVMRYDHTYQTLNGMKITLEREVRLDEPYRADLLQRFISHAGRIGIPDFEAAA